MTRSIVERLRSWRNFPTISTTAQDDLLEAATLIETQAALLEEVRANADALLTFWEQEPSGPVTVRAAIRLGATLAKLKERRDG